MPINVKATLQELYAALERGRKAVRTEFEERT
jgi:hypothetical protein